MTYIPGPTELDETMVLPNQIGGHVFGLGKLASSNPNHSHSGEGSALYWAGEDGGTMVRIEGNNGSWRGVSLHGRVHRGEKRASIGIHVERPDERTTGTGRWTFNDMHVQDCEVGIQCGTDKMMGMCDVLTFGGLTSFDQCDVGFRVKNRMGMGFCFGRVFPRLTPIAFDFEHGGSLSVAMVTVPNEKSGVLLRVHEPNSNGSAYQFGHVKVDAANESSLLVEQLNPGEAYYQFDQIQRSKRPIGKYNPKQFVLKEGAVLRINGHNEIEAGCIEAGPGCVVILDGCRITADRVRDVASPGTTLMTANCYDRNNQRIEL